MELLKGQAFGSRHMVFGNGMLSFEYEKYKGRGQRKGHGVESIAQRAESRKRRFEVEIRKSEKI